jgi:tRNA(Ile)-lysidine synthase
MAMLQICALLAPAAGWALHVASVNHGLRPEAGAEVALVADRCAALGLPHDALLWRHESRLPGNVMDAARKARYGLLADWAQARGLSRVALAHTADDQAETLVMGLSRAAGLDGLSGLRPAWQAGDVCFLRPFLHVTRAELAGYLRAERLAWVDDPTNVDDRHERARVRKALAQLGSFGLSSDRLARVARNLAAAQSALREVVAAAAARHVTEACGALFLDPKGLSSEPAEVQRRLVQAAVHWLSGQAQPPRSEPLARLLAALLNGRSATLAGVMLRHVRGRAVLSREPARLGPAVAPRAIWDGRWRMTGGGAATELRALGADGLRQLPDWRDLGLPRHVLIVTPALWQGESLIAAPLAGWPGGASATLTAPFSLFVISH